MQRTQHLQPLSQGKSLSLSQQLSPHSKVDTVHSQQFLIQLGAVEGHGCKLGLKGVGDIHHRIGCLGEVESDGGALPRGGSRTPGIPDQSGGDKGLGGGPGQ